MSSRRIFPQIALIAGIFAGVLSFGALGAQAQTFLVADVSLHDCSFSIKDQHLITISCSVTNKLGIQPDIRYSVSLVNKKTGVAEDQKVYPDNISLKENETVTKTIVYDAPAFLQGDFAVWVSLDTVDALPLDSKPVGDVSLTARSDGYIQIAPDSCFLSIAGDSKSYSLLQGVDFDANEKVTVTCDAKNLSTTTAFTVQPSFETHLRTSVGNIVEDTKDAQTSVSFAKNKEQMISFILPKALVPQAYDTLLTMQTADGKDISNTVRIHYVLRGASATVQVLSLDKDYYAAGDKAQVTLVWTGSADTFNGSRKPATNEQAQTMQFILADSTGAACAAPVEAPAPANAADRIKPTVFQMSVTKECINPHVTVKITDSAGAVLTEKSISLVSTVPKGNGMVLLWIAVGLLLLGLIAFLIRKYGERRNGQADMPPMPPLSTNPPL